MNKIAAMSITPLALALSIGLTARGVSDHTFHPSALGAHTSREQARVRPAQLTAQVRYRVVELPTLGGPSTSPSNSRPGSQIINNSGVVAFTAETAAVDPDCLINIDANGDCQAGHAVRWQNGLFTDLLPLPTSASGSAADAVNDSGWVVGVSDNGQIDGPTGLLAVRAVLWRDNQKAFDLGGFGGNFNLPMAVNNVGQVAGVSDDNSSSDSYPNLFPGVPGGTRSRAFLWQNGVMRDLGTLPGGDQAFAMSINQSGQVAGFSYVNTTPNQTTGIPTVHPFLWDHGKMTDLGSLGGTLSGAQNAIEGLAVMVNDRGQVLTGSTLPGDPVDGVGNFITHAVLWQSGTLKDLGTLGGELDSVVPVWLTNTGEAVGTSYLPGSPIHHAFLWRNGVMTDLGTLGTNSTAIQMNSRGQIVGSSRIPALHIQHAFLWENDGLGMKDLNGLIPSGTNLVLQEAENINDRGEILVWADPPGCADDHVCGRLVLLVPCGDSAGCVNGNVDQAAASARSVSATRSALTSSLTRASRVLASLPNDTRRLRLCPRR